MAVVIHPALISLEVEKEMAIELRYETHRKMHLRIMFDAILQEILANTALLKSIY